VDCVSVSRKTIGVKKLEGGKNSVDCASVDSIEVKAHCFIVLKKQLEPIPQQVFLTASLFLRKNENKIAWDSCLFVWRKNAQ